MGRIKKNKLEAALLVAVIFLIVAACGIFSADALSDETESAELKAAEPAETVAGGGGSKCCMEFSDDPNDDGYTNIGDLTFLYSYMLEDINVPCLDECDINGSGEITISDIVYLVLFLHMGPYPAECP